MLSDGLVASELFGHEKGAFTGALQRHPGRFELADGGTIFLDDIQNLSMDLQAKLLRAVQEKKFERVGSTKTIMSDFRIIAASNQPLNIMVERGEFRSDLYYRLNVFPINIPPLRERTDDVAPLVRHFLERFNRKLGKHITKISSRDMRRLTDYPFPGNVRELEHIIERAVILSDGKSLVLPEIKKDVLYSSIDTQRQTLKDYERLYIIDTLEACKWRVSGPHGAARILDVKPTTLFAKMKRLGITRG
jgi:transcriptional regulator with GAF, ATPase, and Fis domain